MISCVGKLALAFTFAVLALTVSVAAAVAAPTKGQFIRQGDTLCAQVKRELVPLRRQATAAKSLPRSQMWAAVTRLWSAQIQIQRRFISRFHRIGVPANDSRARALVSGLDRGIGLAIRVRDAFAARDTSALSTMLPAYVRYTASLNRRVVAYGFRVCGH
jgi:hypothetical protein